MCINFLSANFSDHNQNRNRNGVGVARSSMRVFAVAAFLSIALSACGGGGGGSSSNFNASDSTRSDSSSKTMLQRSIGLYQRLFIRSTGSEGGSLVEDSDGDSLEKLRNRSTDLGTTVPEKWFNDRIATSGIGAIHGPLIRQAYQKDAARSLASVSLTDRDGALYVSGSGTHTNPGDEIVTEVTTETDSLTLSIGPDVTMQNQVDYDQAEYIFAQAYGRQDYTVHSLGKRFINNEDPEQFAEAIVYTNRSATNPDADYTTFGYWQMEEYLGKGPNQRSGARAPRAKFGVFAHGGGAKTPTDVFRSPSGTPTATYKGDAVGIYVESSQNPITETTRNPFAKTFNAKLALTATFDETTPSIEGTISNPRFSNEEGIDGFSSITLERTSIADSAGGFFAGDAVAAILGTDQPVTGNWGGRFYGAAADVVSGIFSASLANTYNLFGSFGAQKQSSSVGVSPGGSPDNNPVDPVSSDNTGNEEPPERTRNIGFTLPERNFSDYIANPSRSGGRRDQVPPVARAARYLASQTPVNGTNAVYISSTGPEHRIDRISGAKIVPPHEGLPTEVTTTANGLTIQIGDDITVHSDSAVSTSVVHGHGDRDYTAYYLSQSGITETDEPKAVEVLAYTSRSDTDTDTDYTIFGHWLVDSDDVWSNDTVIGVFAHGSGVQTPAAVFTSTTDPTATYQGDAAGMFVFPGITPIPFTGKVELTTTFGNDPSIEGMVSDLEVNHYWAYSGITAIELQQAPIANSAGGFFSGATAATVGGDKNMVGQWGGRFYGADADVVSGTFSGTEGLAGISNLIGSFGAEKQNAE